MLEELMLHWQQEQEVVLSTKASTPALGFTSMLTKASLWEGVRFDRSPFSSKVTNVCSCITSPPHAFLAWGSIKQGSFQQSRNLEIYYNTIKKCV